MVLFNDTLKTDGYEMVYFLKIEKKFVESTRNYNDLVALNAGLSIH